MENIPLYNLSTLYQLCNNNEVAVKNMLYTFCLQTPSLVNQLTDSFNNANAEQVSKIAHKLKPSIDYLQIDFLKQLIREVERNAKEPNYSLQELNESIQTIKHILNLVVEELKKKLN